MSFRAATAFGWTWPTGAEPSLWTGDRAQGALGHVAAAPVAGAEDGDVLFHNFKLFERSRNRVIRAEGSD